MNELAELGLLASALAGRSLVLKQNNQQDKHSADVAWTDGRTLYLRQGSKGAMQLQELCVQSALLACGSLDHAVVKKLVRKPGLTQRYLVVEARRALLQMEPILPCSVEVPSHAVSIPDSDSAWDSLAIATSKLTLPPPPLVFGTIRPKQVLRTLTLEGGAAAAGRHVPRSDKSSSVAELTEEADSPSESGHDFSSPVGGGGGIGKLLQKMFSMVRDVKGGGSPGAEAATHWTRTGTRAGARAVRSVLEADAFEDMLKSNSNTDPGTVNKLLYPEWSCHRLAYREDWCAVEEVEVTVDQSIAVEWGPVDHLRRPLLRLAMGIDRYHRQRQGDDIDIDAAIESQTAMRAGLSPDEAVYVESQRHRRDLSVLILLDISGSVAQTGTDGVAVHELQRSVAVGLMRALNDVGDRVALYGFHSQGRSEVHLAPVKRFDELMGSAVMKRLFSLKPGAYSRLGAAVRHGTSRLLNHGGTPRKLLLVISDGLAYDHGYEPAYAAADVRQALAEARIDGVGCLCLSVGSFTETETLRQVFGSAAYAVIPDPNDIGRHLGSLFEAALMTTEIQRRIT